MHLDLYLGLMEPLHGHVSKGLDNCEFSLYLIIPI